MNSDFDICVKQIEIHKKQIEILDARLEYYRMFGESTYSGESGAYFEQIEKVREKITALENKILEM